MTNTEHKTDEEAAEKAGYTGFNIKGDFKAPGAQIAARDFIAYEGPQTVVGIDEAFAPLFAQIKQAPQPEPVRAEAKQKAEMLKTEVEKGNEANDDRMATLMDELVALIPGAVQTIVAMFGQPILSGLVGPVTKFVLNRIKPK